MTKQEFSNLLRDANQTVYVASVYLIMSNGEALSLVSAEKKRTESMSAIEGNDPTGGWLPVGVEINWENTELYCAHSNERIPAAYE